MPFVIKSFFGLNSSISLSDDAAFGRNTSIPLPDAVALVIISNESDKRLSIFQVIAESILVQLVTETGA